MVLRLHNTLTGKIEEFKPIENGSARVYSCGPTVYDYAHIGNLRAYVFTDILRRTLVLNGLLVKQVMNITDIGHLTSDADFGEDKMTKGLRREGKPITMEAMKEMALFYEKAFIDDLNKLNIEMPEVMPRASEHIVEDIEIIKKIEDNGFAYRAKDGLYFDTAKFPNYGRLGGFDKVKIKKGARKETASDKKNPRDFILWRSDEKIGLDSPWGKGFPGWHIECSAMSRKYLGQPFDIHTGGIDHIGTHHNNEIAQSEAAFGLPLANYWLHNEHLNLTEGKMAKSGGNFLTLGKLEKKGISPIALRYYFLGAHYRMPMTFSEEGLKSATNALKKIYKHFAFIKRDVSDAPSKPKIEHAEKIIETVNDDLNTPRALALLWKILNNPNISSAEKINSALYLDNILGLGLEKIQEEENLPDKIKKMVEERQKARIEKNWVLSDELREKIKKFGYEIDDSESGQKLSKIL